VCAVIEAIIEKSVMEKKTTIHHLRRCRDWLRKQQGKEADLESGWKAQNILIGCCQVIHACNGDSARPWLDRRPNRRKILRRIDDRYCTREGNRVLRQLVDYAIVELEACVWVKDLDPGALPIEKEPRRLSKAHNRALHAGRWRRAPKAQKALVEEKRSSDTLPLLGAEKCA
jgi:hypothetical protein